MSLQVTGDLILARLRRTASRAAAGQDFGTIDIVLPPRVWQLLAHVANELPDALGHTAIQFPWSTIAAPLDFQVEHGTVRCWPPGSDVSGSRAGWGATGDCEGDTREGRRRR